MQASNQKGLIWVQWLAQECGQVVETVAVLMGLAGFHSAELLGALMAAQRFVVSVWGATDTEAVSGKDALAFLCFFSLFKLEYF